ncbi:MAG: PepSY domain-containing protein [Thiohalocapsa sp.]|jgi:uncharacterized membrane protein YkoI|uniref:PepSY domain-containing protein n=1 Tax=Thiohalocapsa sp. TaxID=2497641 RepID=UPI0025D81CF2|nr:PepSY domain-containing protein [Thiohalocapsa sp.]MCG6943158.1 PepSY domain-containing protein [Thiohalocapsa sp.]
MLLLCALAADADQDAERARQLVQHGDILPLEQILARVRQARDGTLIELGLRQEGDHGTYVYEVKLLDAQGRLWEMELDAATGEVIEQEPDDD